MENSSIRNDFGEKQAKQTKQQRKSEPERIAWIGDGMKVWLRGPRIGTGLSHGRRRFSNKSLICLQREKVHFSLLILGNASLLAVRLSVSFHAALRQKFSVLFPSLIVRNEGGSWLPTKSLS